MRVWRPNLSRKPTLPVLASLSGALIHRALDGPPPTPEAASRDVRLVDHLEGIVDGQRLGAVVVQVRG